jgi:predicted dinucleotide-binding enzyme
VATLADAAAAAELVITPPTEPGVHRGVGGGREEDLVGEVLIDIANPLDFSAGMPPSLLASNTDSLAEQIQRRLPTPGS